MKYQIAIFLFLLLYSFVSTGYTQTPPEFVLGPGDLLEVSVWRDQELTREVVVRPDGLISFPLIGDIQASGRPIDQLREEISGKLEEYVPDAPVSILVKSIGSMQVYVVGKVNQPGSYLMPRRISVMQLLAMAGGLDSFADKNGIIVIREENDQQKTFRVDYGDISKGSKLDTNILLRPNDTVVVP